MAGYIGTKAALLSTTTASVGGDSTVGGDLTVDTNTLYVDSANNRVGIGNTSPTQALDVTGDIITSGGLYVGGTGSANYLDDYEEGTWTPTGFANATVNSVFGNGTYIKIGSFVHVYAYFSITTTNTAFSIGGLPFSCYGYGPATIYYNVPASFAGNSYVEASTNYINFSISTTLSGLGIMVSATYRIL